MKKMTFAALALLAATTIDAQNVYEAVQIADKDLNGTARFVGMGGAMGALGGDVSTIGTNPAGIGIYRGHDFSASFSVYANSQNSRYMGFDSNLSKIVSRYSNVNFDNAGFVFSMKRSNVSPLRYINLAFNYHKAKSFYKNTHMEGELNQGPNGEMVSQLWQMANQANGITNSSAMGEKDAFDNVDLGWLSVLGWKGRLIDEYKVNPEGNTYCPFLPGNYVPYSVFSSQERGGVDEYDLNASFNIADRVYVGATLGFYDVYYSKHTLYDESFAGDEGYELQSYNSVRGAGVDFKLGLIVRPFEYSPFRVGFAFHTPTLYHLDYLTSATLVSDVWSEEEGKVMRTSVDTYDYVGNMVRSYRLHTPWVYNVSLGYTIGKELAIGAEYEYKDFGRTRYSYPDGEEMKFETEEVGYCLQGVHTLRLGLELNVLPKLALRAGFNYDTAAFRDDAFKNLPYNSISTDTDYANTKEKYTYTAGLGYRGRMFYADLAYKHRMYKEDFFAYADADNFLNATKIKNVQNQVMLTLGVRF